MMAPMSNPPTMLVNPIQERIQRWSERRFQHNLFILRDDLPESVRDLRETATLDELLGDLDLSGLSET